jgi:hypothetical protein
MYWGVETGDGWESIIREACSKAEPLIAKWIEDHKNDADFNKDFSPRFAQIKEKFGTLRLYFTTYPEGFDEIEIEAEKKSETTCEQCGKTGKTRGQGWYYTSCGEHAQDEDRDNLEYLESKYDENTKETHNGTKNDCTRD